MEDINLILILIAPAIVLVGAFLFVRVYFRKKQIVNKVNKKDLKSSNQNIYFLISILSLVALMINFKNLIQIKYLIIYFLLLVSIVYFEEVK